MFKAPKRFASLNFSKQLEENKDNISTDSALDAIKLLENTKNSLTVSAKNYLNIGMSYMLSGIVFLYCFANRFFQENFLPDIQIYNFNVGFIPVITSLVGTIVFLRCGYCCLNVYFYRDIDKKIIDNSLIELKKLIEER